MNTENTEVKWNRKVRIYTFLYIIGVIFGLILLLLITFKASHYWWVGFVIFMCVAIGGLLLLYSWHAKNTAFLCPKCSQTFMVSLKDLILSPHIMDEKLLRCPLCGEISWCKAVSASSTKEEIIVRKIERKEIKLSKLVAHIGLVIFIYLLLWCITLYFYSKLPEKILVHFGIKGVAYGPKSRFLLLPAIASIFPILHAMFCIYSARREYPSYVCILFNFVFTTPLIIFIILQFLIYWINAKA